MCKQKEEMRICKINEEYANRKRKLDEFMTILRIMYKLRIFKQYKNMIKNINEAYAKKMSK